MLTRNHAWTIVLAAGDGSRLQDLTRIEDGRVVPKQFCSLFGGRTLLDGALERARAVVSDAQVVTVVAAAHRPFWTDQLLEVPEHNVIIQPRNCGTAAGILLPLLMVLERDPVARVVILPSDHHVQNEAILTRSLRRALAHVEEELDALTLLGIQPASPDTGYGWIESQPSKCALRGVRRFVEKPDPAQAARLLERGALWNSFLLVGLGKTIEGLFARRLPDLFDALRHWSTLPANERSANLEEIYARLPTADFSREVLQGSETCLRVLEVPPCGWTDLGTPRRVAECVGAQALPRRPAGLPERALVVLDRALEIHARELALAGA